MPVGPGDPAPDFTLPGVGPFDSDGTTHDFTLSSFRGAPVVLVFYPGDDSPVCTLQLSAYSGDLNRFADLGAVVLGLSPQGLESHRAFSLKCELRFPLLADADKQVASLYGVVGPLGFYRRSVIIVDAAGVIRYAHRATAGLTYRPVDELVRALKDVA